MFRIVVTCIIKFGILNFMRSIFVLLLLTMACSSAPPSVEYSSVAQEYNGNPPPPIVCETPKVVCGISCVDISRDMKNCGDCGQECNIADGEFCLAYYCRNVRDFGFTLEPNGPRQYDIRRDLPRPAIVGEDVK